MQHSLPEEINTKWDLEPQNDVKIHAEAAPQVENYLHRHVIPRLTVMKKSLQGKCGWWCCCRIIAKHSTVVARDFHSNVEKIHCPENSQFLQQVLTALRHSAETLQKKIQRQR